MLQNVVFIYFSVKTMSREVASWRRGGGVPAGVRGLTFKANSHCTSYFCIRNSMSDVGQDPHPHYFQNGIGRITLSRQAFAGGALLVVTFTQGCGEE